MKSIKYNLLDLFIFKAPIKLLPGFGGKNKCMALRNKVVFNLNFFVLTTPFPSLLSVNIIQINWLRTLTMLANMK